ncbi:DUF262 domain-containing HNH endonuclease family protein [Novosphingobium sp. BL-8H]|uniref:DUF262 domain-containing protein n=1 Tax=Novosphingobium sp. BL-8H TaxID=3127640 RepID=UPI00375748F1
MDNQLVTLSKIFTERLFRIPDYQRGYAWSEKQLKDFWSDLQQLELDRNHYTGVLTLEAVPKAVVDSWKDDAWIIRSKSYEPYFVVDGQQRLTTAIILIQVILEKINDGDKINYTDKDDIRKKFIFESKDGFISRSYIFGYEDSDKSFNFLKSKIFGERVSGDIEQTVYTSNLEGAKSFFAERVGALDNDGLQILYRKVTQNLLFNIFTISNDVDVCIAFETMNNRGKPLSYLELLKNRLIYLSIKFDEDFDERQKLRKAINECWRAIYHNLGRNKEKPLSDDAFLYTHYVTYFGAVDNAVETAAEYIGYDYPAALLEEMFVPKNVAKDAPSEQKVTLLSVYDYVSSLQDSIKIWYDIFNPAESQYDERTKIWLDKLQRIGAESYHPLMLVFLRKVDDPTKQVALLSAIERRIFASALIDRYFDYYRDEYATVAVKLAEDFAQERITSDAIVRRINESTAELLKKDNISSRILEQFKVRGFYRWSKIRYFLYEYNLDLQNKSKTNREKINWKTFAECPSDYITVEHIYPQQARAEYWVDRFSGLTHKQKVQLRNSLGNLLPLSRPKNASLSNKPFPEKVVGKGEAVVGFRFGSYAENEVSCLDEWGPQQIADRGLKLLRFMEKRWHLDLGGMKEHLGLLGLDWYHSKLPIEANETAVKRGKSREPEVMEEVS